MTKRAFFAISAAAILSLAAVSRMSPQKLDNNFSVGNKWRNVIFLNGTLFQAKKGRKVVYDDSSSRHPRSSKNSNPMIIGMMDNFPSDGNGNQSDCVPSADWQTKRFSTCNSIHEVDFSHHTRINNMDKIGSGEYRDVWFHQEFCNNTIVIKTLRTYLDFTHYEFEIHRIDSLSFERLTSSPNVLDIYGFCGHTVLNELATGTSLYELDTEKLTPLEMLEVSRDIAAGIAVTHSVGSMEGKDDQDDGLLVHGDLAPSNLVFNSDSNITTGPLVKMNDYNNGVLLGFDKRTNSTCMYKRENNCSPYRAPEECFNTAEDRHKYSKFEEGSPEALKFLKLQSKKTDVYHLGNLLYYVYTGCSPFSCKPGPILSYGEYDKRSKFVRAGNISTISDSSDPALAAVKWAIDECRKTKLEERPSAQQITNRLSKVLASLQTREKQRRMLSLKEKKTDAEIW